MPPLPFAAAMFDMDGLLLDTERLLLECFVETRRHFGFADGREVFLACIGLRGDKSRPIVAASLEGRIDHGDFDADWEARVSKRLAEPVPARPGAIALLSALGKQGVRMGVATSTNTPHATMLLERSGLLGHFAHVVGGDQVARHKPDPLVYHKLASRLGVSAGQSIAFEDSNAGTRAAVASGATTVQVPDLVAPTQEVRALGHIIAPNLVEGAQKAGLIALGEAS